MIKTHVYTSRGSHTIKDKSFQVTFLRLESVKDLCDTAYIRPKGKQIVQLTITESDGRLIIKDTTTGRELYF